MEDLISIIVPVYNAEKYLGRCIKSLVMQTYANIEIILVNDGSSDQSKQLCEAYAGKYDNIVLMDKENGGAASARNRGIDIAKGEYLAFVDADDYVQETFIERLYYLCKKYNSEIAICDFEWTDKDNINFKSLVAEEKEWVNTPMEMMFRCCNKDKIKETIVPNKLYKKELFGDFRYPEGMTYEDLAATHKILYKATSIAECNNKMYAYFMSGDSVTRKKYNLLNFNSENRAQNERLEFFEKLGNEELFQKALVSVQRNRIANYCKAAIDMPECVAQRQELLRKYREDCKNIKTKVGCQDKILFSVFKISPWVCVKLLWPIYLVLDRKKNKIV